MTDWKQKIEALIDRLNNERSVYDAELCDVAADTMQALLDVVVAAENVMQWCAGQDVVPKHLESALDKLREMGDE